MVFSTSASAHHPLFSSSDPSNWNQQPPHAQDQAAGSATDLHDHFSGATTGNSENTYIGIQLPLPDFALASSSTGGVLIAPIATDPITSLNKAPIAEPGLKCPRCDSMNTKFCYFNNYSLSQPRHFCRACRRYWTRGGTLRNVPVGGGSRHNSKHGKVRAANSKLARASSKALSNSTRRIGVPSSGYHLGASTNVRSSGVAEMPMQLLKQPPQFPFNIIGSSDSSHPTGTVNGHLCLNSRYDELLCGSNGTAGGVVTGTGSNNNTEFQSSDLPSSMNYSSHGSIFP